MSTVLRHRACPWPALGLPGLASDALPEKIEREMNHLPRWYVLFPSLLAHESCTMSQPTLVCHTRGFLLSKQRSTLLLVLSHHLVFTLKCQLRPQHSMQRETKWAGRDRYFPWKLPCPTTQWSLREGLSQHPYRAAVPVTATFSSQQSPSDSTSLHCDCGFSCLSLPLPRESHESQDWLLHSPD